MANRKTKQVKPARRSGFISRLRNNFFTGLVVVLPVFLTIYMLWAFVGFVDNRVLPLVPEQFNPRTYLDANVRGLRSTGVDEQNFSNFLALDHCVFPDPSI